MNLLKPIETTTEDMAISAIATNSLLLLVAYRYSQEMGFYKYFIMYFAVFELMYAASVFFGRPVIYASNYRLVAFSNSDYMNSIGIGQYFASFYCAFYQSWLGLVAVMFLYRYILMCRPSLAHRIQASKAVKTLIVFLYGIHVIDCFLCGFMFCIVPLPTDIIDEINDIYGLNKTVTLGYQVTTFLAIDDSFTMTGLIPFLNHSMHVNISLVTIIFCGVKVYRVIRDHEVDCSDFNRSKQIFYALVFQATIPLIMYQVPLTILISLLFVDVPAIAAYTPIFVILSTLPKFLDPLFVLFYIRDYRDAMLKIFCRRLRFTKEPSNGSVSHTA